MADSRTGLGRRGEQLAAEALQRHGYRLIARNWRCSHGEVDLVFEREAHLHFVEVRTRRGRSYPTPEQTLTARKRARMELVARSYLGAHAVGQQLNWQLSFVALAIDAAGRLQRITFYPTLDDEPLELA